MKNIWILIILACISCKEDPQPTSFEGVVVYEDDGARLTDGRMSISSRGNSKNIGAGPNVIDVAIIHLDSTNGRFTVFFEANEDITECLIRIRNIQGIRFEIEDCGSIPCDGIKPGKAYENLIIEVPRQ